MVLAADEVDEAAVFAVNEIENVEMTDRVDAEEMGMHASENSMDSATKRV